jgi:hypothetical protein
MAYYPSSVPPRPGLAEFMRAWFNPARWTAADGFVALTGVVLAVSVFLPWFKSTVTIRGTDGDVTGDLIDPPGTLGGLAAHWYLVVPLAVALLEMAVIVARYLPARRPPRLPFHRPFLVAASGVNFVAVIMAALVQPPSWYGDPQMPPNFHIAIQWTYGALVAAGAAVLSLAIAVAALRSDDQ